MGKLECTTCNKIFHSYQALGGYIASHQKNKGCFASKIDDNIEFENDLSREPTTKSKIIKIIHNHNNNEDIQNMKIKGDSSGSSFPFCNSRNKLLGYSVWISHSTLLQRSKAVYVYLPSTFIAIVKRMLTSLPCSCLMWELWEKKCRDE
ncbi:hypothetical protein RYX36_030903 [Vicia faba]